MSAELIIWPMIIMALTTLWIYIPMGNARKATIKSGGVKASVYFRNIGEPEESLRFSTAIRNQFETPVLFYAVCLAAFVTDNANIVMILLAFIYAIIKVVHVYIHTTTGKLRHRFRVFVFSWSVLGLMWIVLAISLTNIFS